MTLNRRHRLQQTGLLVYKGGRVLFLLCLTPGFDFVCPGAPPPFLAIRPAATSRPSTAPPTATTAPIPTRTFSSTTRRSTAGTGSPAARPRVATAPTPAPPPSSTPTRSWLATWRCVPFFLFFYTYFWNFLESGSHPAPFHVGLLLLQLLHFPHPGSRDDGTQRSGRSAI